MNYHLLNIIKKKFYFLSNKFNLQFKLENSIKIKKNYFNSSRFIFILANYNNNNNIIYNNLKFIKNILNLDYIPKYKKGFIIEFIYGIDLFENKHKVYITVFHNNITNIYAILYNNNNNNIITRYYFHKQNFYKKYSHFKFINHFKKFINIKYFDDYYLVFQNKFSNKKQKFIGIHLKCPIININKIKKFLLYILNKLNLNYNNLNYNYLINYLNNNNINYLNVIAFYNTFDELNLYFNIN